MSKPISLPAVASEHIRNPAYLKSIRIVKSLFSILALDRHEFFIYMGPILCVDFLSDTKSCCGFQALGQLAHLLPCLPPRRLTSWRSPPPNPWSPALKTTFLPLVRANTSSVPELTFPGDIVFKNAKNFHIVSIRHPDAPAERQSSKGVTGSSMNAASQSGGTVEEGSKLSACLQEVGPSCTNCKTTEQHQ